MRAPIFVSELLGQLTTADKRIGEQSLRCESRRFLQCRPDRNSLVDLRVQEEFANRLGHCPNSQGTSAISINETRHFYCVTSFQFIDRPIVGDIYGKNSRPVPGNCPYHIDCNPFISCRFLVEFLTGLLHSLSPHLPPGLQLKVRRISLCQEGVVGKEEFRGLAAIARQNVEQLSLLFRDHLPPGLSCSR